MDLPGHPILPRKRSEAPMPLPHHPVSFAKKSKVNGTNFFSQVEQLQPHYDNARNHHHHQHLFDGRSAPVFQHPRKSLEQCPEKYKSFVSAFFNRTDTFTAVQSELLEEMLESDESVVVCAPTGSGKTGVLELAMSRLFGERGGKVLYIAPLKAIVEEKVAEWNAKLCALGIKCVEMTGDTVNASVAQLAGANIIATTPEKWDSITRRWRDNTGLIGQIGLVLVDEVHVLDDGRGATLEAVICRMKTIRKFASIGSAPSSKLRFVAISATVSNAADIGSFIEAPPGNVREFGESYRPVPLQFIVSGYPLPYSKDSGDVAVRFDRSLDFKLLDVIRAHSLGRPVLVFVVRRKSADQAAEAMLKQLTERSESFIRDAAHAQRLELAASRVSKQLGKFIRMGIGIHNGGQNLEERRIVKDLFMDRDLSCLFATTTMSAGVNVPAYLVIVKSTQFYDKPQGWVEMDSRTVLQMAGRAGRPQFDTEGKVIIMTTFEKVKQYQTLLSGSKAVESHLHEHLIEHLNSEIALGTITDISVALEWAKSTFFYVRAWKNPADYFGDKVDEALKAKIMECIEKLLSIQAVKYGDEDCFTLLPTPLGISMSQLCVAFDTMKVFLDDDSGDGMANILEVICQAKEFEDEFHVRLEQKKYLTAANKDGMIRYHINTKGGGWTTARKINCVIQTTLGGGEFEEWKLRAESTRVCSVAARLCSAMLSCVQTKGSFERAVNCIKLKQALTAKTWEDVSGAQLRQLPHVGPVLLKKMLDSGISSLDEFQQRLVGGADSIVGKGQSAFEVVSSALAIPRWMINSCKSEISADGKSRKITVYATVKNPTTAQPSRIAFIAGSNKKVWHVSSSRISTHGHTFTFEVPQKGSESYSVLLANSEWVGGDAFYTSQAKCQNEQPSAEPPKKSKSENSKKKQNESANTLTPKVQPQQSNEDNPWASYKYKSAVTVPKGALRAKNDEQKERESNRENIQPAAAHLDLVRQHNAMTTFKQISSQPSSRPYQPPSYFQPISHQSMQSSQGQTTLHSAPISLPSQPRKPPTPQAPRPTPLPPPPPPPQQQQMHHQYHFLQQQQQMRQQPPPPLPSQSQYQQPPPPLPSQSQYQQPPPPLPPQSQHQQPPPPLPPQSQHQQPQQRQATIYVDFDGIL